jgi:hypothetical protein
MKAKPTEPTRSSRMSITVASDVERETLFAELWDGDEQWGEIVPDARTGAFTMTIYAPAAATSYTFDLAELQRSIEDATSKLLAMGYSPDHPVAPRSPPHPRPAAAPVNE